MARVWGRLGVAAVAAYPLLVAGGFILRRSDALPVALLLVGLGWPFLPAALGAAALFGGQGSKAERWWLPGAVAVLGAALELIGGPLVYALLAGPA
jgi:hypothetical protein